MNRLSPSMYPMSLPAKGSPEMVTRIDLRGVMEWAGSNLLANLDPAQHYLPNWIAMQEANGYIQVGKRGFSHNLGRWWDAMLRLESATGFSIPENTERAMLENLKRFFDNPEHLCLQPLDMAASKLSPDALMDLHSPREGLLALTALVRHRQNAWAREEGQAMCRSLLQLTREDGTWVWEKFEAARRGKTPVLPEPVNHGRLIEALVWFYQATGSPDAFRAADRFARYHLAQTACPDGAMGPRPGKHTHSYFGTLRGLLLFGELTGQRQYIDTIAATYAKTVRTLLKKSGYISHDLMTDTDPETTSPGDAAQLALWLALRHNHAEYLDDVERMVRARLVPCQITEIPPPAQGAELAPLLLGGLGGMHEKPHYGKIATFDITAAVLHSLVDVYRHIAVTHDSEMRIHFHFDYQDQNVCIASRRSRTATVNIIPKAKVNLFVRLPRWTPRESLRLVVAGKPLSLHIAGDYAFVPQEAMPAEITLTYALPVSTEIERTDGVDYAITWRGDEIIGISPNSNQTEPLRSFQPFYPDAFVEQGWK